MPVSALNMILKKLINLVPFLRKNECPAILEPESGMGRSFGQTRLNCIAYSGYAMQSLNGKPYLELGTGLIISSGISGWI
jgi:hypothetical protein